MIKKAGTLKKIIWTTLICVVVVVIVSSPISSQTIRDDVEELNRIDVNEKLGEYIPLDLEFVNDRGDSIKLGDYFGKEKPVLLLMAYYRCPMLCNLVLNGLSSGIHQLGWTPGENYQVLTVGFDPREDYKLAAEKKKNYMASINLSGNISGWDFLVGEDSQSKELADALGFQYYYDEAQDQYAHPAVVFVLGEDGKISRYLYGLEFKGQNLKLSLVEAGEGKIGTTVDRLILYCFHYDPDASSYVLFAGNVMRLGGIFFAGLLFILLIYLWRRERTRKPSPGLTRTAHKGIVKD